MIRAQEIHARLGSSWPAILAQLGVPENFLQRRPGPCPGCGGSDRYTFDNKRGRGDYFCRQCKPGDGFKLLELVHGWTFAEARRQVLIAAGIQHDDGQGAPPSRARDTAPTLAAPMPALPPERVRAILRGTCPPADCADAVQYLISRGLWPLPADCTLRAHAGADYFEDRVRIGRFPALVAAVRDQAGEVVTAHVTYLSAGQKLAGHEPRKILSALTGRSGCAVRLMPFAGEVLGIAEGIETALSAAKLESVPVWAALNTSLLAKFEPPPEVTELRIYADRDEPGLLHAAALAERLQGRVRFKVCTPRAPAKDWNDELMARKTAEAGQ